MSMTESPTGATFVLPDTINIAAVEGLYEQLSAEELEHGLALEAGAVQSIDTAGVQLLLALQKRLQNNGGEIDWLSVSPAITEAFESIGLNPIPEQ